MSPPKTKAPAAVPDVAAGISEITELPRATLYANASPAGLRVNRSAAELLRITHRFAHRMLVPQEPPAVPPQLSSEEKLLRAIFGEAAAGLATEPHLDDAGMARIGEQIRHGAVVINTEFAGKLRFVAADEGEVESATRETAVLAGGISERVTVVVRTSGPLEPGDTLWSGEERLGIVEQIVEDGAPEPRIFLSSSSRTGAIEVMRRLPTARQSLVVQSTGASDPVTREPAAVQPVAFAHIALLASRGLLGLASDFLGIKAGTLTNRTRSFEAMVKGEAVLDPWKERQRLGAAQAAAASQAPPTSPTERLIFSFFEGATVGPPTERFSVAQLLARALGIDLTLDGHALRISLSPDGSAVAGSSGEISSSSLSPDDDEGLASQRIFGPLRDYECRCGKLKRMKFRGQRCDVCNVECLSSRVRRERFGHIVVEGRAVPVLPPDARFAGLDEIYQQVARERSRAAADSLRQWTVARLSGMFAMPERIAVEYSGAGTVLVDPALAAGRAIVPAAFLAKIGKPLLCGWLESKGFVTTIKSAVRLLEKDDPARDEAIASVFSRRPLLVEATGALGAVIAEAGRDPVIRLDPALAARLALRTGDRAALHLPVCESAVREARLLYRDPSASPRPAPANGSSWLRELTEAGPRFEARLFELAAAGATDPCTSAAGAALLGGWEIPDDAGLTDDFDPPYSFVKPEPAPGAAGAPDANPNLDRLVDELELSVRTANCLANMQVTTIRQLVQRTEADCLKTRNFGRSSLHEIKEILAEMGLSLGMKLD